MRPTCSSHDWFHDAFIDSRPVGRICRVCRTTEQWNALACAWEPVRLPSGELNCYIPTLS